MSSKFGYQKPISEERKINLVPKKLSNPNFLKRINLYRNRTSKFRSNGTGPNSNPFNHSSVISRKDILNSYDQNLLKEAWIQLCNYIHKNYETGKGTYIKGLGTFTFLDPEINLEGTTNQYKRDLKLRRPIFIVSPEFHEFIRPGMFTKTNGLIPFTQKNYNRVNMKIINYNEIAIALNISKDECMQIFKHIICDMGEQVKTSKYISKELPGIGEILIKDNIFGVKFNDDFMKEICDKTEKLIMLKKTLYFNADRHRYKPNNCLGNINNQEKSVNEIIPKVSPVTRLTNDAENWLEKSMNIKPSEYDNQEETKQTFNKVENNNPNNVWNSQSFFEVSNPRNFLNKKEKEDLINSKNNNLGNIPEEIQRAIIINKGPLIRELKEYDRNINGFITRFEVIRAFDKCNIHPKLTMEMISDLINPHVQDSDFVDYNKLITIIIKKIKHNLKNTSFNPDGKDNLFNSFNTKYIFGPEHKKKISNEDKSKKSHCSSLKKISGTKINQIEEINKEENKEKNNFNFNEYNNLNIKISEVENEIMSIKLILDDVIIHKKNLENSLKYEKFMNNEQEIDYLDFIKLLKAYSITYPEEKILKILKFIHIVNPLKMNLNLLNIKFKECKISSSEMTDKEIEESLMSILFDNKLDLKQFLFSKKQEITQNEFVYLLHDKTKFSDNILQAIFQKLSNNYIYLSYDTFLNVKNSLEKNISNPLNDNFYISSCKRIFSRIKSQQISIDNYFMKLVRNNYLRKSNSLNRIDFILAMEKEEYEPPFTEKELNFIFDKMKDNQLGDLDRKEFKKAISKEYNALHKMQDLIKKMKLTFDDLTFRMDISPDDYWRDIIFWEFKIKIKKIGGDYSNEFIESLYIELVGDLDKTINIKYLLDSLNVYHKNDFIKINNESFINNFISNIRSKVDYHTLKSSFEQEDKNFSGKISKALFCQVINNFTKLYISKNR